MSFRAVIANIDDPNEPPEIIKDVRGELPKIIFTLPKGGNKICTMIEGSVSLTEIRKFHKRVLASQGITDRNVYLLQCKGVMLSSDGVKIKANRHWYALNKISYQIVS